MKEVEIEIVDIKLDELGIDQEPRYAPFRFMESQFIGYWISRSTKDDPSVIVFYTGAQTFNCKNIRKNIEIFESILNKI